MSLDELRAQLRDAKQSHRRLENDAANVRAPFLLSRAAAPLMREAGGGSIVNIGTTMIYRGGALDRIAYSSSKGALHTMTKIELLTLAKP